MSYRSNEDDKSWYAVPVVPHLQVALAMAMNIVVAVMREIVAVVVMAVLVKVLVVEKVLGMMELASHVRPCLHRSETVVCGM